MLRRFLYLLFLLSFLTSCTPKVAEEIAEEQETETSTKPKPEEKESPCPTFLDAPNPDQTTTDYVLYRDFLKAGDWDQAYDYWEKVYEVAPAADGRRNTVLADGITFNEYFLSQTPDTAQRDQYIEAIFRLYDQIQECFPEGGGYASGRKGFDLYYKYPNRASKEEMYALFKQSIDTDGVKTNDFVINPFTALLYELHVDGEVSIQEARQYETKIREIIAAGLENCEGTGCDRWKIVEEYALSRLEAFEAVKGFYDCDYYVEKYFPNFEEDPTDCDMIRTVYSRLRWGGCPEDAPQFEQLRSALNENCRVMDTGPVAEGYECLRNADYQCAIDKLSQAAEEAEEAEKKGSLLLTVAKIYDAHLKNYPRARHFALQAAEVRPDWGEPYILIGRLYASSGPLCGPGRGWDSQVVVWAAIDAWAKAKQVDPSVTSEANRWIGRYSQYMPSKEDVFIRNLKTGQSYYIGCWIQRSTRIRTVY